MFNAIVTKTGSVFETTFQGCLHAFSPKYEAKEIKQFNVVDWALMAIMLLAQLIVFFSVHDYSTGAIISLVAGLTMVVSLIFVNKGLLSNYAWGLISAIAWLVIAMMNHQIGSTYTQYFYIVMQFVGMYFWQKDMNTNNSDHVHAKRLTRLQFILVLLAAVVLYFILNRNIAANDGVLPLFEAALLPLGIVGQILMSFGQRSQWLFWITINVLNVVIYIHLLQQDQAGSTTMLMTNIIMLLNSFYGTYQWMKEN
ncbi:nicotinamide mononucleotide transporter [Weissella uvarum]|uniref:nicotinamide riboside transporter PnuC n=1 Tax=Weissella uvarum TaxID=1479233 RepID=UPI001960E2B2|nr:nicotinamide riboside transporter PnuC [Weissella uvarum]MBM7616589.1 nicotinamide mononucleotide transporter [Weissella uvarum]MCM0594952.1 nicotinamide mononucleotide transporter [Weissella uvarum]